MGKRKEKRREGKKKEGKRRMEMGERKMDEGPSGDFWDKNTQTPKCLLYIKAQHTHGKNSEENALKIMWASKLGCLGKKEDRDHLFTSWDVFPGICHQAVSLSRECCQHSQGKDFGCSIPGFLHCTLDSVFKGTL